MTVHELIDRLFVRIQSGELKGSDQVPADLFDNGHEDVAGYLARKCNIGSDVDGQKETKKKDLG